MEKSKLTEITLIGLLPQLNLDITKLGESIQKIQELHNKIEEAYRNIPHNPNIRWL